MTPMNSTQIESLLPAVQLACADVMESFTAKKAEGLGPASALAAGSKMSDCVTGAFEKMKDSPCNEIRAGYIACLEKKGRLSCRDVKTSYEKCAAKHLGKMD